MMNDDLVLEMENYLTPQGWRKDGYLTIRNGQITALGTGPAPADLRASARQVISAAGMAVLPGLTNAHTHLSQTLMRGLAAGRPLERWLKEVIWPLEDHISPTELRLAAELGLVENLHSGVTHVVEHQKITSTPQDGLAVCAAAEQSGLRLTLARGWSDQGPRAETPEAILADLEALFKHYRGHAHITIANGPMALWRTSATTLQSSRALAQSYGAPTHLHFAETREEVQRTQADSGLRPLAWLDAMEFLGPDVQLVHAVWIDAQEIDLLRQRGVQVIHCPTSNAVLGSGSAPLVEMRRAGIPVRLGTDGPASNDAQDTFESMKMALCLAHLRQLDPAPIAPADVLEMALAGNSLTVGSPADLICVDLRNSHTAPLGDLSSALVLCCHASDVDTAIVDGKVLMQHKHILYLDETALIQECEQVTTSLRRRAGIN